MAPAYVYAPVISRGGGGMGRSGANFGPGPGVPQLRDPNGDPMEFPDEVNRRFQFDASTENPSTGEDSQTREPEQEPEVRSSREQQPPRAAEDEKIEESGALVKDTDKIEAKTSKCCSIS